MKKLYTLKTMPVSFRRKELVIFDLDGTLAKTKSGIEPDMAATLRELLEKRKVAVISGGMYKQFRKQLVGELHCPAKLLLNLFLFPTTATAFYRYDGGWKNVYAHSLSKAQKQNIRQALKEVFKEINYVPPKKVYGKTLEDRGSQMSYSFLGQDVVAQLGLKGVALKEEWTRNNAPLKFKVASMLQKRLPDLEARAAGFTTIDITKRGIDKAYGVREIEKTLGVPVQKMVFVGDALQEGGNDAAARKSGIDCIMTSGPEETEKIIKKIIL